VGLLLGDAERERIAAAIADAERRTAAELVVADVRASDSYAEPRALLCGALLIAGGLLVYELGPLVPGAWIFAGQALLAPLGWWLLGRPWLLRRLVPGRLASEAVHARAQQLFIERGLTETRDRSGVLILISELEHRVEILADRGIHARIGERGWRDEVERLTRAIRSRRAADGVLEIIDDIATRLASALPPRPDDRNELSDSVQRESR
jgi:putative membrane protein